MAKIDPATGKETRIRWTELEWFEVARKSIPMLEKGMAMVPALMSAQKHTLPKARRREETAFAGGARAIHRDYVARIKAGWVPEGAVVEPPPAPAPAPKVKAKAPAVADAPSDDTRPRDWRKQADDALEATFTGGKRIYWTHREWAMMACAVKARIDAGDSRPLGRVFFETQVDVLPRDRCRKRVNFALADLQKNYDAAIPHIWELPKDLQAKLQGRASEHAAHLASTREGLDAMARAGLALLSPATAQAAPAEPIPAAVPTPAPQPSPPALMFPAASGDPLAARIAMIVGSAAQQIAHETRTQVMAEYDRQLDRLTLALASTLREYVHGLVASELGGVSTPPPTATPAAPPVAPPQAAPARDDDPIPQDSGPAARRVKVDIVGMERVGMLKVRDACERLGLDYRLIDSDLTGNWSPRDNVVLATRLVPHDATRKAKQSGANLLFATAGPASVVGILESLAQHHGTLQ